MNGDRKGWFAGRWGRMSTGLKMLLILSLGLLPLGVIAILASIYNAQENRERRAEQTLTRLDIKAQRLNDLLARTAGTIRAASAAIAAAPSEPDVCAATLRRLAATQAVPGRYALHGPDNRLICATAGYRPPAPARPANSGTVVAISPDGNSLRLVLFDGPRLEGIAEFSRQALSELTFLPGTSADFNLELVGGGRRMLLREDYRRIPFVQAATDSAQIGDGSLQLRIKLGSVPIRMIDAIMILLPVMMWFAAAAIGWAIIHRLLLRPLGRMQKIVSAYRPGDPGLDLPSVRSPAREIGELGQAFDHVTRTVAHHEAELEAAVERQTRLVREVHHRVKNNLQVVASLLNLHSRGSPNEEVAAAYASIQRRVDALAVVHRNHYAELEENRGVALKPLISELAANLRATAPASASGMQIRLDAEPFYSTQDAAVSVAFLVTEIVEFGMLSGAAAVSIVLEASEPGYARLSIEIGSLAGDFGGDEKLFDRFDRIVTGLARQLRSTLERDAERGRYSVMVAVVSKGEG